MGGGFVFGRWIMFLGETSICLTFGFTSSFCSSSWSSASSLDLDCPSTCLLSLSSASAFTFFRANKLFNSSHMDRFSSTLKGRCFILSSLHENLVTVSPSPSPSPLPLSFSSKGNSTKNRVFFLENLTMVAIRPLRCWAPTRPCNNTFCPGG